MGWFGGTSIFGNTQQVFGRSLKTKNVIFHLTRYPEAPSIQLICLGGPRQPRSCHPLWFKSSFLLLFFLEYLVIRSHARENFSVMFIYLKGFSKGTLVSTSRIPLGTSSLEIPWMKKTVLHQKNMFILTAESETFCWRYRLLRYPSKKLHSLPVEMSVPSSIHKISWFP